MNETEKEDFLNIFLLFKVIKEQLTLDELENSANTSSASSEVDCGETDLALGKLNGGRRIDYVLQEVRTLISKSLPEYYNFNNLLNCTICRLLLKY